MQQKQNRVFRELLISQFEEKLRMNPRYSLRAFAKFLNISDSALSKYVRNKRDFSHRTIERLCERLDIDKEKILTDKPDIDLKTFATEDFYSSLSEPYYDMILEMAAVFEYLPDLDFLAKNLKLEKFVVATAIRKLEMAGLIKIDREEGTWEKTNKHYSSISKSLYTSESKKTYQKRMLMKSLEAIENIPVQERQHTSLLLSICKDDLEELRELSYKMQEKIRDIANSNKEKHDAIYGLQISLFPMSDLKLEDKNEN